MIQSKDHILTVNIWWEPKKPRTKTIPCGMCHGSGKIYVTSLDYDCNWCGGTGEQIIRDTIEPAPEIPKEFVDYIQKCYEEYLMMGLHHLHKRGD
jgi:RecJ-like exonuclease